MEKSSKNRLMPQHTYLFATDSLFDRIARAVCRAGTLPIDAVRAMGLASRGYAITTQKIPGTITPKNRLLMGHPIDLSNPHASLENGDGNRPHDNSHKGVQNPPG